jgi:hypothetical protein
VVRDCSVWDVRMLAFIHWRVLLVSVQFVIEMLFGQNSSRKFRAGDLICVSDRQSPILR